MNHAGPARSASRSRSGHPGPVVAAGTAQVVDDLGELGFHVGVPGRVGEGTADRSALMTRARAAGLIPGRRQWFRFNY